MAMGGALIRGGWSSGVSVTSTHVSPATALGDQHATSSSSTLKTSQSSSFFTNPWWSFFPRNAFSVLFERRKHLHNA